MFFAKPGGDKIINRTAPGGWDFTKATLIEDADWHTLDLSSIVPPRTKFVQIHFMILGAGVGDYIAVRPTGQSGAVHRYALSTLTIATSNYGDGWIAVDANRTCEYLASNVAWTTLNLEVGAWVVPA